MGALRLLVSNLRVKLMLYLSFQLPVLVSNKVSSLPTEIGLMSKLAVLDLCKCDWQIVIDW